jgi:putative membrane protein
MGDTELGFNEKLALDRTRMAADRTLMAWVRTALALISFGFTIYKFLQALQSQSAAVPLRPGAHRDVGLTLIGLGTVALFVACAQHWVHMNRLSPGKPYRPWELTFIVAFLLGLLGFLMFGSILLHAGPFG